MALPYMPDSYLAFTALLLGALMFAGYLQWRVYVNRQKTYRRMAEEIRMAGGEFNE